MIQKLDKNLAYDINSFDMSQNIAVAREAINKINELVDAVNSIVSVQEKLIDSRFVVETKHEEPADPYAEQRNWRGKLCKFWDDSDKPEDCVYDVLYNIFDLHHADCPFQCGNGEWYEYCEPVKPDSELIYHGE